jgi:hypothetical protein
MFVADRVRDAGSAGRECRVVTAVSMLSQYLFRYQVAARARAHDGGNAVSQPVATQATRGSGRWSSTAPCSALGNANPRPHLLWLVAQSVAIREG